MGIGEGPLGGRRIKKRPLTLGRGGSGVRGLLQLPPAAREESLWQKQRHAQHQARGQGHLSECRVRHSEPRENNTTYPERPQAEVTPPLPTMPHPLSQSL